MKIRFNVKGYIDRRGPAELAAARALEQARADKALQQRFDEGVRRRVARRLLSASMGRRGTGPMGKAWEPNTPRPDRCVQPTALQRALTAPATLRRQAN